MCLGTASLDIQPRTLSQLSLNFELITVNIENVMSLSDEKYREVLCGYITLCLFVYRFICMRREASVGRESFQDQFVGRSADCGCVDAFKTEGLVLVL